MAERTNVSANEWRMLSIAVICVCIAIGVGKWFAWQAQQHSIRVAQWDRERVQWAVRNSQASDDMHRLLRSNPYPNALTAEELAEKLGIEPLSLRDEGNRQVAEWEDTASDIKWRFSFLEGKWVQVSGVSGKLPARVERLPFYKMAEELRASWFHWDFGLLDGMWLALLVPALAFPRWRKVSALALFVLGFTCYVGWLVHPGYSFTIRGYFSNDMLVFGNGMLLIATAFVTYSFRHLWPDEGIGIQFRLRTMLVVTSLIGVSLALGGYGVVLGLTFAVYYAVAAIIRYTVIAQIQQALAEGSRDGEAD